MNYLIFSNKYYTLFCEFTEIAYTSTLELNEEVHYIVKMNQLITNTMAHFAMFFSSIYHTSILILVYDSIFLVYE